MSSGRKYVVFVCPAVWVLAHVKAPIGKNHILDATLSADVGNSELCHGRFVDGPAVFVELFHAGVLRADRAACLAEELPSTTIAHGARRHA